MQISERTKRFLNRVGLVAVLGILMLAATGLVSASEGRATVVQPSTRAVTVQKFNDLDGDGVRDDGEALLNDWQITVKKDGNTVAQGETGDNGAGTVIFNLAAGTYQICETLQSGWENPNDPDLCKTVTVPAGVDPVPGPTSTTVSFIEIRNNGSQLTNSYSIEFVSLVGRTWTYRVTELDGRDLSHWTLGIASCVTPNTNRVIQPYTAGIQLGQDGNRPFYGIKWNTEGSFTTGLFSFTLDADYPAGTVQVQAKAGGTGPNGDGTGYSTIIGPICDAPAPIPPVLFGNRQLGSITIYKQVNNEAFDRQFAFTYIRGTNAPQTFYLSDTRLNAPQTETELFNNLPTGTYTFSENLPLPAGWTLLGFVCSTQSNPEGVPNTIRQVTPLQSGNGFSVNLNVGEHLYCSFGNAYTPPPSVGLNLTAECAIGDLRYWRVTGDDQTNDVNFTWDGPGSNDGSGQVDANARYYFTTMNSGDANTTILRWFNPATNSNQQVTKAHNNAPCVYHVTFVKTWTGVDEAPIENGTILTAESSIATATCGYTNSVFACQYNRKSNNASIADLEVPFGETYSVTETGIAGWGAVAGVGTGFEGVDGFDVSQLPNALVYDLPENPERYCETTTPQQFNPPLAKFCTHEVVNERQRGTLVIAKDVVPDANTNFFYEVRQGVTVVDDGSFNESSPVSIPVDAGTYDVEEMFAGFGSGYSFGGGVCVDQNDNEVATLAADPSGNATTIEGVEVGAGDTITCTFTNYRRASIMTRKETDPDGSAQVFHFVGSANLQVDEFNLSDGDSQANIERSAGVYTITEEVVPGWALTDVTCTRNGDAFDPDVEGTTLTVELDWGDAVDCTFYNERQQGTLVIQKDRIPNGTTDFNYEVRQGDTVVDSGIFSESNPVSMTVDAGSYDVEEVFGSFGSGFVFGGGECVNEANEVVASIPQDLSGNATTIENVEVGADETITCTFINYARAQLTIYKQTDPDGDPTVFEFTGSANLPVTSFDLSDGDFQAFYERRAGTYSVTEQPLAGWALTSVACEMGEDEFPFSLVDGALTVELDWGNVVTCTFYNEQQRGTLIIAKDVVPDAASEFIYQVRNAGTATVVSPAAPNNKFSEGNSATLDLLAGSYDVEEVFGGFGSGFSFGGGVCVDQDDNEVATLAADPSGNATTIENVEVGAGDTITCTFTNYRRASIMTRKETEPDGDAQVFHFVGSANLQVDEFNLVDGGNQPNIERSAGVYTITEEPVANWTLTDVTCTRNGESFDPDVVGTTLTVELDWGDAVDCTFYNAYVAPVGSIRIFKYNDVNGNGAFDDGEEGLSGWEFTIDGSDSQTTDENGYASFENLLAGDYEICENVIDGWENTDPGDDGCETVSVASGQTAYVDFGNHQNEEVDVFKFNDVNGDGNQDEGEEGLQGWEFTVYDANENVVDSGVTNANGFVSFELPIGTYFVCETDSRIDGTAWVNTLPGYSTTIDGNPCREIVIGGDGGSVVQPGSYSVVVSFPDEQGQRPITNSYLIEFLGVDTDTNTWRYRVTEQDGKDLSHWSIGMETCEDHVLEDSFDPSGADLGDDPSTNGTFIGIKWNTETNFTSGEFSFQLDGNYPIGTVGVLVKAGTTGPNGDGSQTSEIAGPNCDEETPEDVVLVFGNQQQQGTLTIRKEAGLAGTFNFTGDLGNFSLNSNTQQSFPVDEGTFTVTETAQSGWTLANVTCDTEAYELTMLGVAVSVPAGDDVTCTFTNRPSSATITIIKQVEPETSDASFGFNNAAFSLGDGESEPFTNLTPGVAYTYTEDAANGFTLASIDCGQTNSDTVNLAQRSVTITPAPGENVTCTFTNTQNTGTITITKVLEGEEGNGEGEGEADSAMNFAQNNPLYTFRISRNGGLGDAIVPMSDANVAMDAFEPIEFSLEAGQTSIPYALAPDSYIVEEIEIPEGFHLEDIDCGDDVDFWVDIENNQVIITLESGQDVYCTFTNAPNDGTITIIKEVVGQEGGEESINDSAMNFAQNNPLYTFRISRNGGLGDAVVPMADANVAMDNEFPITFDLEAGQSNTLDLAPDSYIIKEIEIPEGFHLEDITCSEGVDFELDLDNDQIIITINSDDDIECTFTNAPNDGTITITKVVEGQEGGEEAISDPTMNFAQNNPLYTFRISRNGGLGDAVIFDNPMVQAAQELMVPTFPIEIQVEAGFSSDPLDLAPDSYIIEEIDIPEGFHLEDIDCGEGVDFSVDIANNQVIITINSDDDIECIFTNAGDTGSITVIKSVVWGDVTPTEQTFNICVVGPVTICQDLVTTNGGQLVFNDLPVGAYSVTEPTVDTALWTYTGANVTLQGHEDAEQVTVTNSRTAPENGTLIIRKESDVAGTFNFTSGSEEITDFNLTTVADDDIFSAQTSFSLPAGNYDVSETIPTDWLLASRICTSSNDQVIAEPLDTNGVMVTLASGETVTCVFTNDYQEPPVPGSLTVIKSVNWQNASIDTAATFTINVTGPNNFSQQLTFDYDGGSETLTGLTPGQYNVAEVNPGVKWTVSYSPSQNVTVTAGTNGGAEVTVTNTHARITTCEGFDYAMYAEMYLTGRITVNGNTATGRITNNGTQDCAILVGLVSYSMFDRVIDNQIIFDYDPLTPQSVDSPFTVIPPNGGTVTFMVDLPVNCAAQVDLFYGPLLPSLSGQRYGTRLLAWTQLLNRPFCQRPGSLILRKDADAAGEFTFNIPGYGNVNLMTTDNDLSDEQQISLNPGSYSITEAAQDNWVLSNAVCDNVAINNGGTFTIVADTTVTCVFTNDYQEPEVTVEPPVQPIAPPVVETDTDGDNTPDSVDTDDDNDGVEDAADAFPLDVNESVDTDGDNIGNNADTDDDNDSVEDAADAFPLDATESVDTDGDNIGNNADTDDDADGVEDAADAFPLDATESVDTDGDNIGDNADTDDDNDGMLDTVDAQPLIFNDSDGDSIGDGVDDSDGDTIFDGFETDLDADGDTFSNADEVAAGTNPYDSASFPAP